VLPVPVHFVPGAVHAPVVLVPLVQHAKPGPPHEPVLDTHAPFVQMPGYWGAHDPPDDTHRLATQQAPFPQEFPSQHGCPGPPQVAGTVEPPLPLPPVPRTPPPPARGRSMAASSLAPPVPMMPPLPGTTVIPPVPAAPPVPTTGRSSAPSATPPPAPVTPPSPVVPPVPGATMIPPPVPAPPVPAPLPPSLVLLLLSPHPTLRTTSTPSRARLDESAPVRDSVVSGKVIPP
jgi:hypothetical protein